MRRLRRLAAGALAALIAFVAYAHAAPESPAATRGNARDRLQAELSAQAALGMARLALNSEPRVRSAVAVVVRSSTGRPSPQLDVDLIAQTLLLRNSAATDADLSLQMVAANGLINVNRPIFYATDDARRLNALQLFALMGGYTPQSELDALFDPPAPTRQELITALLDYWDADHERHVFDPGTASIGVDGEEPTEEPGDPVLRKNAPLDSLQELRLLPEMSPQLFRAIVQADPDDLTTRRVTVYGAGALNINHAAPEQLLARLCSLVEPDQPLCVDPIQAGAFLQLLKTARELMPTELFVHQEDLLDFVSADSGRPGLYQQLQALLGDDNPLFAWTPLEILPEERREVSASFIAGSSIFLVQATVQIGKAEARLEATINNDLPWQPAEPIVTPEGKRSVWPMGVLHRYRLTR